MLIGWIDPASDNNEEGVQLYNEDKHDEAISKFTDAQSYVQESQSLNFNIANTHYKKGKFPEAEKSFKDVIKTKDNTLKAKANYNLGNTMYKQDKFKEALDFYKKTIELTEKEKGNLKDKETASIREDAKYNYEFVQKKMEEMQKEQQEKPTPLGAELIFALGGGDARRRRSPALRAETVQSDATSSCRWTPRPSMPSRITSPGLR